MLRRLIQDLLRPYRGRIVIAAIALIIAAAAQLLIVQGLRIVIDRGFVAGDASMLDNALLGLFGIIPLATGILGSCPIYTLFGWSTCPRKTSPKTS